MNKDQKKAKQVAKHKKKRTSAKNKRNIKINTTKKEWAKQLDEFKRIQDIAEEVEKTEKLKIIEDVNRLRDKSKLVEKIDKEFLEKMVATLLSSKNAIGLSAVQVGRLEQYSIVWWNGEIIAMINPTIVGIGTERDVMEEGCLSLPEKKVSISRPTEVSVTYMDQDGEMIEDFKTEGLLARAIQHELDHLEGKLIVDHFQLDGK